MDVYIIDVLETEIKQIESYILKRLKGLDRRLLFRLKTVDGIGDVLALTLLLEIQDIHRFDTVQQFCSYGRLVKDQKESAGKVAGQCHSKIGNPYIKWAFSEAAILFMRCSDRAKRMVKKQQMQWTHEGAHLLIQTRTALLNGDLRKQFETWYRSEDHDCESEHELNKLAVAA